MMKMFVRADKLPLIGSDNELVPELTVCSPNAFISFAFSATHSCLCRHRTDSKLKLISNTY